MNIENAIKTLFKVNEITLSDRIYTCESKFETLIENMPEHSDLLDFLAEYSFNNILKLTISNPDDKILKMDSSKKLTLEEYKEFLNTCQEEDTITINLEINKKITENILTIYNYKNFTDDLLKNSLFDIMKIFSAFLYGRKCIIFYVLDDAVSWSTKTVMFSNNLNSIINTKFDRIERIKLCKDCSYFQGYSEVSLIPDDFDIIVDEKNNIYSEVFNKIKTIISLIYISSVSSLDKTGVTLTINGQRNISYNYSYDKVIINNIVYNIYDWIYTDGNPVDKSIIARNIISLHCKYSDLLDIDPTTFLSITSNYGLYLKDNVSKYLEAKTKVSEFISEIGSKIGDNALELWDSFKKNLIAMLSFFLTVILVNLVSERPLDNIFTKEITFIIEMILIGSLCYFFISIIEVNYKYRKIKNLYNSLKVNYEDVFSEEEIKAIFDDNRYLNESIKSFKIKIILSSIIWIVFIVALFINIEIFTASPWLGIFK